MHGLLGSYRYLICYFGQPFYSLISSRKVRNHEKLATGKNQEASIAMSQEGLWVTSNNE